MLDSTQYASNSSQTTGLSELNLAKKQSFDNNMHSPTPVKRKTCILKSWEQNDQLRGPVISRSFNKLEEFIKRETIHPISPFKTEKKMVFQTEQFQDQSFSKMVKSDELFDKKKQASIKELRNQTKNPLGKEELFPEKSFENLKFAKDSLSYFEDLEKLHEEGFLANEDEYSLNADLLIQKELELLKELSFDN